ncbi:MAG: hypothetical protein JSS89_07120 [Bacteroidetes bacterium]|nr:hypothetical protein [Bacteroidota bacterium]
MLHTTITELYASQRAIFKRIVTMSFAFAGMYWFLIYGIALGSAASDAHSVAQTLRAGQTLIYFILLFVWGLDYFREQQRMHVIIDLASARSVPPDHITRTDVEDRLHLFSVFTPSTRTRFAWVVPMVNIVGLSVSTVLICLQWLKGVQYLVR